MVNDSEVSSGQIEQQFQWLTMPSMSKAKRVLFEAIVRSLDSISSALRFVKSGVDTGVNELGDFNPRLTFRMSKIKDGK